MCSKCYVCDGSLYGDMSMAFTVSVGEADFAALRREKAYYVDKTRLINKEGTPGFRLEVIYL